MIFRSFITSFSLLVTGLCLHASEEGARREVERFEKAERAYEAALESAGSPEEEALAQELKPDAVSYARRLIREMGGQGKARWVVPYIAWIFNEAPQSSPKHLNALRDFFERDHLRSPGAGRVALALANYPDPRSLDLARAVREKHPDPVEKGLAALGVCLMLSNLGDDPSIINERRELLPEVIIHAADEDVDGRKVADIVRDELYIMKNLIKGREAPEIKGLDVSGRELSLKSLRGQIVILVFWSGEAFAQGKATAEFLRKVHEDFAGQPVTVLAVNSDKRQVVRKLTADGVIVWKNILDEDLTIHKSYKITTVPKAFIIDAEGIIQYIGVPGPFVELTARAFLEEK